MIEPGLYVHFKNKKTYRVLFMAPWWSGQDQFKENEILDVVAYDSRVGIRWPGVNAGTMLFTARWSGNDNARLDIDETIVIYVALYDEGRVSARPLKEFGETIQCTCTVGGCSVLDCFPAYYTHEETCACGPNTRGDRNVKRFTRIGD